MKNNIVTKTVTGVGVKRFTYMLNDTIVSVKPKKGEEFILHQDNLGDRVLVWIICVSGGEELWRHNVAHTVRITWLPLKKAN